MTSGVAVNASTGFGNYNGGFASLKMADWRGLTMQSNFTWSKALGTAAVVQASSEFTPDDPFNPIRCTVNRPLTASSSTTRSLCTAALL